MRVIGFPRCTTALRLNSLAGIRPIRKARLGERLGTLSKNEIKDLCALLADMYGTA
jgi:mRNA-degrading endonuclease toxin of MazEF toxin-antitoxin module